MRRQTFPEAAVELDLDHWLYFQDAAPVKGCATCSKAAIARTQAVGANEHRKAGEAARTIRTHVLTGKHT